MKDRREQRVSFCFLVHLDSPAIVIQLNRLPRRILSDEDHVELSIAGDINDGTARRSRFVKFFLRAVSTFAELRSLRRRNSGSLDCSGSSIAHPRKLRARPFISPPRLPFCADLLLTAPIGLLSAFRHYRSGLESGAG